MATCRWTRARERLPKERRLPGLQRQHCFVSQGRARPERIHPREAQSPFMNFIADSGFIVSLWSKTPRRRNWAIKHWERATLPMLTSAANLQEAGWLLENHEVILRMVRDGDLRPALDFEREA